jgi:hypothetical protein
MVQVIIWNLERYPPSLVPYHYHPLDHHQTSLKMPLKSKGLTCKLASLQG